MISTQSASYTGVAKILHWLIALAIIFMLCLGWSFDFLPNDGNKFALFQLHKSIGITILLLSLVRLVWRLTHRAPPLPATMPRWERTAAHAGHFLLYTAMIVMPLSGWIMVTASPHNIPTILYSILPWPGFPGVAQSDMKPQIDEAMDTLHSWLAWGLAALIAGHAAAALKHHFISRDDILLRMAPNVFGRFLNKMRGQS